MSSGGPTRQSDSLADVVEMLLDKGVVINADIVVSIGDTELLGVQLRAAIASFETAAEYGLEFPDGTDMERVEAASGRSELPDETDAEQTTIEAVGEEVVDAAGDSDDQGEPGIRSRPGSDEDEDDEADEDGETEEPEEVVEETNDDD
ncbi:gas vesicle protein GvpJ [Halococcus sp. IIIV-5B]|uniref:gas vesicle protein GvpJ n=1 Tax=Halococcus sp. IIIV-5B TaxID=2321230 RepID=UPI000E712688|nr:gas vesicle protein [Halococcus sp. IIIV-5B]RJS97107.1 gas vesicle protein [Halococcus sp. IIIV-5B]